MFVFKLVQAFLIPSVFLFILTVLGFIAILRNRNSVVGKSLLGLGIFGYYFFSLGLVSDALLFPLEHPYHLVSCGEVRGAHSIVLLLGGSEGDVLRTSTILQLHSLCKHDKFLIVISGRDPLNSHLDEAGETRQYLIERGIPAEEIVVEDQSRTTGESASNLKSMLHGQPFLLVTSAYHMRRSIASFRRAGLQPIPAPADFKVQPHLLKFPTLLFELFPSSGGLRNSEIAFHEYYGIVFYKLMGK